MVLSRIHAPQLKIRFLFQPSKPALGPTLRHIEGISGPLKLASPVSTAALGPTQWITRALFSSPNCRTREADHSYWTTAEGKSGWSYTFTSLYLLVVWLNAFNNHLNTMSTFASFYNRLYYQNSYSRIKINLWARITVFWEETAASLS
jgi:hypothetical protein